MLSGLVRFLFSCVMLAAFIWFAVTVPLGKRTLWGHVHAIFATQEARDLADGTEEEAKKVAQKVKQELRPQDMARTVEAPQQQQQQQPSPSAPSPSAPSPRAPSPHAHPASGRHVKVPLPPK